MTISIPAQAFALADAEDGRLLTDDGDARSFVKDKGVTVVGSVGVLLAAIDAGKIDEPTADEWLSIWIDRVLYAIPVDFGISVRYAYRSPIAGVVSTSSGGI
nr:hypothetical protein [Halobellus ruber]